MPGLSEVAQALRTSSASAALSAVVAVARRGGHAPEEVAELARVLASSGSVRARETDCADVASTGGPGSLSTLVSPLAMRQLGLRVPKIAVPGRPAGGIDTLGTVRGYRTVMDAGAFDQVLDACGYAHALAGADLTPADGLLFAHRQQVGAQQVPELVVASLLAKKIAAGLTRVVLDVRVGPGGNLGSSREQAALGSAMFVEAAAAAGIRAVCVLSDSAALRQPFVGRGEALVATAIAVGLLDVPRWLPEEAVAALLRHVDDCRAMARLASDNSVNGDAGGLADPLVRHLAAQGAGDGAFQERVSSLLACPRRVIEADRSGFMAVELSQVRDVLVAANARTEPLPGTGFSDAAGLTLLAMPGQRVRQGQPLAYVRGDVSLADDALAVRDEPLAAAGWHGQVVA